MAVFAAECAERVLPVFEAVFPKDLQSRMAIEALESWLRGECNVTPIRFTAKKTHAAARKTKGAARFAVRAASQAVSVAHAKMHAVGAAYYASKVWPNERQWQLKRLRKLLRRSAKYAAAGRA